MEQSVWRLSTTVPGGHTNVLQVMHVSMFHQMTTIVNLSIRATTVQITADPTRVVFSKALVYSPVTAHLVTRTKRINVLL